MTPACTGHSIATFFPEHQPGRATDYSTALAVCAQCPVRAACRRKAEEAGDIVDGHALWGVVGGCAPVVRAHRPPRTSASEQRGLSHEAARIERRISREKAS